MICTCTHRSCYYIFEIDQAEIPEQCPDCGNPSVRPATPEEAAWFYQEHRENNKAG